MNRVIVTDSHVTIVRTGNRMIKDYLFFATEDIISLVSKFWREGSGNQTEFHTTTVSELFIPVLLLESKNES